MNSELEKSPNAIITGASRGLGKAISEIFADNGYNLYLSSKDPNRLSDTADELSSRYPDVSIKAKAFDLSLKEEAIAMGHWIASMGIRVNVLVNNAGTFEPGGVHNEPDGALELQIATNLYSAYHLTRTLLPGMIKQDPKKGLRGHIFNICSIAALKAYENGGAYSISKFALHGFSKNLRQEMMPHGIKVTSVLPGAVMTDSWSDFDNSSKRIMEAQDVAKMVFACTHLSPQACVEEIVIRPQLGDL